MPSLLKIAPYLLAVLMIFMAGVFFARWMMGDGGKEFAKLAFLQKIETISDKAQIWQADVDDRASLEKWLARFDTVLGASDAERGAFRLELKQARSAASTKSAEAAAKLKELDDAQQQADLDWKNGRTPADINCNVLHIAAACAALSHSAASAPGAAPVGLPGDGAAGPHPAGTAAALPAAGPVAGGSGDGRGPK